MASIWQRNIRAAIESILTRFPQRCVILTYLRAIFVSQTSCIMIRTVPSYGCYRQALDSKKSINARRKREGVMTRSKAERFRAMSAECERQAELASEEPEFREL